MIHIPLHQSIPPENWVRRAEHILTALEQANTREERHAIIDSNQKVWRALKRWLLKMSNKKCWYSETKAEYSYFHVEHYRPKKKASELDDSTREGYWWLAFDWTNLRVCGGVGNTRKGIYFPLRLGSPVADPVSRRTDREVPLLLDPTKPEDVSLLSFRETGDAVPQSGLGAWSTLRVTETVRLLNLDHEDLVEARRAKWLECHIKLSQMEEYINDHEEFGDPGLLKAIQNTRDEIFKLVDVRAPLSATAVTCLLKRGGFAARLVTEARALRGM